MMYIYCITRKVPNMVPKFYIGQSTENPRKKFSRHMHGKGNKALGQDVKNYGREYFSFELIYKTNTLVPNNDLEQFFIDLYKKQGYELYNVQKGGGRPQVSEAKLGINISVSIPTLLKLEKIKHTSLEKYGTDWPSRNPEVNKKRMETLMKRYGVYQPGYLNAKLIRCIETGKVYASASSAARDLELSQPNVSRVANGYLDKTGGYTFEWVAA